MKNLINQRRNLACIALTAAALLGVTQAQAQSVSYNFSDNTSDGWSLGGFSSGTSPAVSSIGGQNYIFVPIGGFQVANVASGYTGNLSGFNAAMAAAAANPSGYDISYNYYINTANITGATFLQVGTFVNSGSGYYAQDYGSPNELQLTGAQLSSGQIFQGTITVNMATAGYAIPPADTFFRLGLVENGTSGATGGVYFSNITVAPVPEPATLSLCGLGLAGLAFLRRRKA